MADQERFLSDIRSHQMTVLRNDGVDRHLKFGKPGDSSYWFELLTWPGVLCIRGDCGTYVFSRIIDMFEFFRSRPGGINPGYWAEKCLACDRSDGIEKWSEARFRKAVVRAVREYYRYSGRYAEARECFRRVRDEVLNAESEYEAWANVYSFEFGKFSFQDFFESRMTDYTFRFLWCLRAIVWGIQQFDDATAVAPEVAHG